MDLERVLVSKLVFTGRVEDALARNISEEHFADDECRDLYVYLIGHVRKYRGSPSLDAIKHDRPDFEFIQTQETVEWVLDRFAVMVKRRLANEMLIELGAAADDVERNENIDIEFLEVAQRLITAVPTGAVSRLSEVEKRIREYELRKSQGKPLGVPYGFPTLDRALGGVVPRELVTVLAFTNVGKSTLLRVLAVNFWLKGYTPLYFTLEMGADEILSDMDAMLAELSRDRVRQMSLTDHEITKWRSWADAVKEHKCDIPVIDSLYRITPEQVYAETLRHKPDVVIVDYVGLMKSSRSTYGIKRYQQLSDITQDLKIHARMLKVPIIMAAQANRSAAREGAELDTIADAISIGQDSDTVIGLHQNEDMERDGEMEIRVIKSRRGPRPRFRAIWNHEKQEFREKTMKDLMVRRNGGDPIHAN